MQRARRIARCKGACYNQGKNLWSVEYMITQSLHTHSTWDDGKNTAEEMVQAAIGAGLESIGLSVHSPMPRDCAWAIKEEKLPAYRQEIASLREKYREKIRVYCGVEWDVLSKTDLAPYDYVIGSVHRLPAEGFPEVDNSPEATARYIRESFAGDSDAAAVCYFEQLLRVAQEPQADIVGHFDLITKFDQTHGFFNPESPVYRRAARRAMEALVSAGKIFEINTGAISRGARTTPYPSLELLRELCGMGGHITVSADAHFTAGIACAFDRARELALAAGFAEIWELDGDTFAPRKI